MDWVTTTLIPLLEIARWVLLPVVALMLLLTSGSGSSLLTWVQDQQTSRS